MLRYLLTTLIFLLTLVGSVASDASAQDSNRPVSERSATASAPPTEEELLLDAQAEALARTASDRDVEYGRRVQSELDQAKFVEVGLEAGRREGALLARLQAERRWRWVFFSVGVACGAVAVGTAWWRVEGSQ